MKFCISVSGFDNYTPIMGIKNYTNSIIYF